MAEENNEQTKRNEKFETNVGLAVIAGAAVALGATAAYLYGTESGRRHRTYLSEWLAGVRADIISRVQELQYVDRDTYYDIIDDVVARYKNTDDVDMRELLDFAADMKHHYATIKREIEEGKKKPSKSSSRKKAAPKKKATATNKKGSSKKKT